MQEMASQSPNILQSFPRGHGPWITLDVSTFAARKTFFHCQGLELQWSSTYNIKLF